MPRTPAETRQLFDTWAASYNESLQRRGRRRPAGQVQTARLELLSVPLG